MNCVDCNKSIESKVGICIDCDLKRHKVTYGVFEL